MPPFNTIVSTPFTLPTYVFANGQVTGNPWNNATNLFLLDGDYANSNANQGMSSDVTLGGYNFEYNNVSIPQGAVITGIEFQIVGYRGAQTVPPIALDIAVYDNTNGADDFYPYTTPFTGLTPTVTTTTLGTQNYLFATSFTVDQINNLKINLTANGDISLDTVTVRLYFYIPAPTPEPTPTTGVCIDCESPIQVQEMYLALPFLAGETKFYLQKGSLTYPNGVPVQPGDVGSCGGKLFFVFDEGKKKADGNFEENVTVDTSTGSWTVLPSGIIEVDIASVNNRGLDYKQPATHVAENMSNHDANSKVIISNNTPYNLTLVRTCQADLVFSPPINVEKEGADVVNPVHTFNFKGSGVQVQQNGTDPFQADITIAGGGTSTPVFDATSSATSGNVQVPDLTWVHTCSGTDRLLTVQVSMEEGKTVTGITYNGVAMTFEVADELNGTRSEIWYLVAPSVGTHNIVVTFSADSYTSAGAESWNGVDQSVPIGASTSATGTSLVPSLVLNTTFDNSIVVDGLSTALTPILLTKGAGQIENWHRYANTDTRQGASSYESAGSAPDAVTMDWSITQNTDWSLCAIEIKGITQLISPLTVEDEGITVDTSVNKINFIGAGVTATQTAPGEVEVDIPGGGGGGSLEVQENGVTVETNVTVINVTGDATVTNPAPGQVDIDVQGGGGGGGIIYPKEQLLGIRGFANTVNVCFTQDGTELFVATNDPANGQDLQVTRYTADVSTGMFYETHSEDVSSVANGDIAIAVMGNYVYVAYRVGTDIQISRLDKADLAGLVAVTPSITLTTTPYGFFSDGTFLYVGIGGAGNFRKYSIAGTVITLVATITGGLNNCTGAWYESGNVYMTEADGTMNTYTISGTTFVLVDSIQRNFSGNGFVGAEIQSLIGGGALINAVGRTTETMYFGYIYGENTFNGGSGRVSSGLMLKAFGRTDSSTPEGAGGGSGKFVGVGERDNIDWFNIQYPFLAPGGGASDYCMWDMNNLGTVHSPSFLSLGTQDYFSVNATTDYVYLLPDFDNNTGGVDFDTTKQVIFQAEVFTSTPNPNEGLGGIGFDEFGAVVADQIQNLQGTNTLSVGFVRKDSDGTWYARCADGASFTETLVAISDGKHVLRCEYDPGHATPQARFYVDSALVATITTDVPSAVASVVGFSAGNGQNANDNAFTLIGCPSFAVEI